MKKKFSEVLSYVLIFLLVLFIKFYVISPVKVNGLSMYDTLYDKDIMILNEAIYKFKGIKRFDIVVCKYDNEYLIKRVIGLPGEKIKCVDGEIYINDKKIEDDFSKKTGDFEEVIIPTNEYFVMGDNRDNSMDSRILGCFSKNNILGRTKYVIFPFKHFGKK